MSSLRIHWSDQLENLAQVMFSSAKPRTDPFETECTVVGSPVMAGWLKQYFLYDFPKADKSQSVLACWDFQMLHPFVNDWLAKATAGTDIGERSPSEHPYSKDVLQWRLWNVLSSDDLPPAYASLIAYIGTDPQARDRKRWGLVQHLAQLFDDYQNYRPEVLRDWQSGNIAGLDAALLWQPMLWNQLVNESPDTYLQQFLNMKSRLPACGIEKAYRRITVFHISAMPKAYMQFFAELGKLLPVELFIFNPSQAFWIEDPSVKQHLKALIKSGDELAWMDSPHPLLSGFGRGIQALLGTLLDVEADQQGYIDDATTRWGDDTSDSLLHNVQQDIRHRHTPEQKSTLFKHASPDPSLQFHSCHGPMREVEVAKDLITRWFADNAGSAPQPRDVQILVPDMETYAPFIESVFQVTDFNPPLPCSISKRPTVSGGTVGTAFVKLMQFNESRMSATEVIAILELDPVRERYRLDADDISAIRELVNSASIRWGRDGEHINERLQTEDRRLKTGDLASSGARSTSNIEHRTSNAQGRAAGSNQAPGTKAPERGPMPDTVTWRRGLDRLIAGFAVGRCEKGDDIIDAGELGTLRIADEVEGASAALVGQLAQFFDDLCTTTDELSSGKRPALDWTACFRSMLDRFFRGSESSFRELADIRNGISSVEGAAAVAGNPEVAAGVVATAIETQLGGMAPAGKTDTNAVLVSPMRTMQVTPHKLIIMLGVNEGIFPRTDQRPAFDLLSRNPQYGDRSLRHEDRLSFLEAIMSARERLIIAYTGRNITNNKEIPPSPAVTEFLQYLNGCSGDKAPIRPVEHKLHGFHPAYYCREPIDEQLFSYSQANHAAARILAGDKAAAPPPAAFPKAAPIDSSGDQLQLTLEDLQAFFINPAEIFYTNVLKVRLSDPGRNVVQDNEMFDGDALDQYHLNQLVIDSLLAQPDPLADEPFEPDDDYFSRLQEHALIPLGTFGRGKTRQQILAIQDFLNNRRLAGHHATLRQSLQAQAAASERPVSITLTCGPYTLSAELPLIESPSAATSPRFLLCFRYASIKANDLVKAWLAHLVGHAAGETFETLIAGRDHTELALERLPPLACEDAMDRLHTILELHEAGNNAIIPFAPKTSYAYAEQLVKGGDSEKANDKAKAAWGGYRLPECNNRYLYAVWGNDGPMEHPEFAPYATVFWQHFSLQTRMTTSGGGKRHA